MTSSQSGQQDSDESTVAMLNAGEVENHEHKGYFKKLLHRVHHAHEMMRADRCMLAYAGPGSTGPIHMKRETVFHETKEPKHVHEKHGHLGHLHFPLFHKRKAAKIPLPDDILVNIFEYFAINTVLSLRLVSKQMRRVIDENVYKMVMSELKDVDRVATQTIDTNMLSILGALSGFAKVYPCPPWPPVEVIRWIKLVERRLEPIAEIISVLKLVDNNTDDRVVPRPLVLDWGRIVCFYWKFVETHYGQALPFFSPESKFLEIGAKTESSVGVRNAVNLTKLDTTDLLAVGVCVLNVYSSTYQSIPATVQDLYEAAFALGPDYVAQWTRVMNIFVPKTKDVVEMQASVVHRTQVALSELHISAKGPSLVHQLTKELERRDLMGTGEEFVLE